MVRCRITHDGHWCRRNGRDEFPPIGAQLIENIRRGALIPSEIEDHPVDACNEVVAPADYDKRYAYCQAITDYSRPNPVSPA